LGIKVQPLKLVCTLLLPVVLNSDIPICLMLGELPFGILEPHGRSEIGSHDTDQEMVGTSVGSTEEEVQE
jgi:hypothetical protein